jgi:hypothetical protein
MNVIKEWKESSTILLMYARVLHYTYDRGWLLFKICLYIYVIDYLYM